MKLNEIPHSRPWINKHDQSAVMQTIKSGFIARGKKVFEFEKEITNYTQTLGGVACNSGTSALVLALKSLDINIGDEIILPTYVCRNVLSAIISVGASPILCDVDEYGLINNDTVKEVLSHKTKAIIAVHIFGHACDINNLKKIGIPIIEDACQSFGLRIQGRLSGSIGTIGIFSFHATKCLTTGEGGMLISNSKSILKKARELSNSWDKNNAVSLTSLSDIQATLGLSQLSRYEKFLARRKKIIKSFHEISSNLDNAVPGYLNEPSFLFRYTLRSKLEFNNIYNLFLERGISVRRGVDELLHRQLGISDRKFPIASKIFTNTFSLPLYPSLKKDEVTKIKSTLKEIFVAN